MFDYEHHQRIKDILIQMDRDLLVSAQACFGGGAAIIMEMGEEYRETADIYFLCQNNNPGWQKLRSAFFQSQFKALFPGGDVREVGTFTSDQHGIRGWVSIDDRAEVKIEVCGEGRIPIGSKFNDTLGVLQLDRTSMFAEKLCANIDRIQFPGSYMRDIIDIIMMEIKWGPIPEKAFHDVAEHYGEVSRIAYEQALDKISGRLRLDECCRNLKIPDEYRNQIINQLGDRFHDDLKKGFKSFQ